MNQVPQSIWNRIAEEQPMATELGKHLLNLTDEKVDKVLDRQTEAMKRFGVESKVILAYQTVLPLYLESTAITKFVVEHDAVDIRMALPEILDRQEASYLMAKEFRLTTEQQSILEEILPPDKQTKINMEIQIAWLLSITPTLLQER